MNTQRILELVLTLDKVKHGPPYHSMGTMPVESKEVITCPELFNMTIFRSCNLNQPNDGTRNIRPVADVAGWTVGLWGKEDPRREDEDWIEWPGRILGILGYHSGLLAESLFIPADRDDRIENEPITPQMAATVLMEIAKNNDITPRRVCDLWRREIIKAELKELEAIT